MVEVEVGTAEAGMVEAAWRSLDGGLCRSETDWWAGGRRGWLLAAAAPAPAPGMVPGRSSMSLSRGSVGQRRLYVQDVQDVPSDHGRGAGESWMSRRAGAGAGAGELCGHVLSTIYYTQQSLRRRVQMRGGRALRYDAVRCGAVRCGAAMWHAGVRWRCVL